MFFGWIVLHFVLCHLKSLQQFDSGIFRQYDLIDISFLGSQIRIREHFLILSHRLLPLGFSGLSVKYVEGTGSAHDSDFRIGIGEVDIAVGLF